MDVLFQFEYPWWETVARGTAIYFLIAVLLRVLPKRQTGNLAPNDVIALVIVGDLVSRAIAGDASRAPDLLLLVAVVIGWDYVFNLVEYYFPRWRRIAQDTPTLLIHRGEVIRANLKKEKLTEEELWAGLRKQGISDPALVEQAVLEADGQISVVTRK
ncbi:DUF421 domain-containing protein [Noviherbaspirillum agri]